MKRNYKKPQLAVYGKMENITHGRNRGKCDEVRRSGYIKNQNKCNRIYGS